MMKNVYLKVKINIHYKKLALPLKLLYYYLCLWKKDVIGGVIEDKDKQDGQSKGCCGIFNCCSGQDDGNDKKEIIVKNDDKNKDSTTKIDTKIDETIVNNNINPIFNINPNDSSNIKPNLNNINPSINNSNLINNNINTNKPNNFNPIYDNLNIKPNPNNNISLNKDNNSNNNPNFKPNNFINNHLKDNGKESKKEIDDSFFIKGDGMDYSMYVDNIRLNKPDNKSFCSGKDKKIEFTLQFKRKQQGQKDCLKEYKMILERVGEGELKVTMHDVKNKTDIDVKILNNKTVKENIKEDFDKMVEKIAKNKDTKNIIGLILSTVKNNFFVDNLKKLNLSDDTIKEIVPKPFLAYYKATCHQNDKTKHNITKNSKKDKSKEKFCISGFIPGTKGTKESKKGNNRKLDESNNNLHVDLKNNNNKKTLENKDVDFFMSGTIYGQPKIDEGKTEKKNNNNNNINYNNNINNSKIKDNNLNAEEKEKTKI